MKFWKFAVRFAPVAALCLTFAAPAHAQFWQCATYARAVSGIDIRGNAGTWWSQAEGRYERGHAPEVGAVLAFSSSGRMPAGHVAMVSKVISDREVLLTHANWSHRGKIERNVRAVDVSPEGDWTQVKVWFAPTGDLGNSTYATKGFIYSNTTRGVFDQDDPIAPVEMASADTLAAKQFLALK